MADLNTDVRYIKGVGEAKAKRYGEAFLEEIKRYLQEKA